tara:strand:+ start:21 stop:371 length:351 start_codon:yes stop_codon:yes gene_type:complete
MIDTDKYEGHTRGPWRYYDDEEHDCWVFEGEDIEAQARVAFFAFTPCEGIAYLDDPDLNLMIDAPLLLAEVKRLRDVINKAMQQHTVLHMRQELFESSCIDVEGQYESGHWERDEE